MKNIYSCIDIGSNSIKLVVCELYKGRLNLLAASSKKSKGIKKGLITDVEEAKIAISEAFRDVEEMLGIKIKKVIATIPSYFAEFKLVKGKIDINSEDKIITGDDVINSLQAAVEIADNMEVVTMMPIDFSVESGIIKDPIGQVSSYLQSRSILVKVPKKNVYSVVTLLTSLGIEVVDVSLNCIGDIYTFKTSEMDNNIGAVVNIGSETTNVSLYNKGIIIKNVVIGMGGKNIDSDIAYMYKLNLEQAKHIKEKFALAHKNDASLNDFYEVTNKNEEVLKINQFEVSEIAMSRIEEILTLVHKEILNLTNKQLSYTIVTGGVSNMTNFEQIVKEILGNCAIIGDVKLIGLRNNKYSSSVGNIVYFINKLKLKGKSYTMVSNDDVEKITSVKRNVTDISNESMLGKVFGYFFGE